MSAIARFLPSPRLHEVDRVAVGADPARAWEHVRALDLYRSRVARGLFTARTAPDRLAAWLRGQRVPRAPRTMRLDDIVAEGNAFRLLAEEPGRAIVVGAVGRFWEPRIPFADVDASTFATFDEPGFGKVAWSIEVAPRDGGGTWITIDLRVTATDEAAWRDFLPYWILIGRFSRLIRRLALREAARTLGRVAPDDRRELPGDDVLPNAPASWTDAITIEAPPSRVWPWLVQMGCRRAGWYSIDRLDNGGARSADRIVPELQHIAVGDVLPATPKGPDGFAVLRVEPERTLVLGSPDLLPDGAPWAGATYSVTWAFDLEPVGDDATRLVVRVRGQPHGRGPRAALTKAMFRPAHAIMEHAQLANLKRRAEAHG